MQCNDMVFKYVETFERLMKVGIPDAEKACLEEVPVCKGINPSEIPRPTVMYQAPKHPKDRKSASQKVQ